MDDLIEKLEGATEGDREWDFAIAKATGWQFHGEAEFKNYGMFWRDATNDEWKQLPFWTTSLDAALSLVPEGWSLADLYDAMEPNIRPWVGACLRRDEPYKALKVLGAKTYALALCIAALKAGAAGSNE